MNKEVGALISLQPNASRIANKLGLDKYLITKRPTIDEAIRIYDTTGELVKTIHLDNESASKSRVLYLRVDLHDSLKEAVLADDGRSPPAKIHVSSRVITCDPEIGSVTLENGQVWKGDLIVGADGIHSVLRSYVLTDEEKKDSPKYEPQPTTISAYRLILPTSQITERIPHIKAHFNPTTPNTHMIFGDSKRVVMGPARQGAIFGITALVPDENLSSEEQYFTKSRRAWTSKGSLSSLLETFSEFPSWLKEIFALADTEGKNDSPGNEGTTSCTTDSDLAIWQLRDINPLPRWSYKRLILAGDAAHAMLPTQGQGASQSFEDAEALGEFISDALSVHELKPAQSSCDGLTINEVGMLANRYFECRFRRVSLIQAYSRDHGLKAGTIGKGTERKVNLNPEEFMNYNTSYTGARDWEERQRQETDADMLPVAYDQPIQVAAC